MQTRRHVINAKVSLLVAPDPMLCFVIPPQLEINKTVWGGDGGGEKMCGGGGVAGMPFSKVVIFFRPHHH